MMRLYIWVTPQGKYYHKVSKGYYRYNKVGDVNQYKHKIVHIINLDDFMSYTHTRVNYKKMLVNDCIHLLEKLR